MFNIRNHGINSEGEHILSHSVNIRNIMILISNVPVYAKNITAEIQDVAPLIIVGGFFNALQGMENVLSKHDLIENGEKIRQISYDKTRLLFFRDSYYTLVGIVRSDASKIDIELMEEINNTFYETFKDILMKWDRDLQVFKSFDKICDDIISKYM